MSLGIKAHLSEPQFTCLWNEHHSSTHPTVSALLNETLQIYWLFILHYFKDLSQILLLKNGVSHNEKAHVSFFARYCYKIGGGPLNPQYLRMICVAESLCWPPQTITTFVLFFYILFLIC